MSASGPSGPLVCNRVMVLDLCQNFISTHYLENKWIEFHQICAFILTISRLGLLPVMFCLFLTELWPLIGVRIFFPAQYL